MISDTSLEQGLHREIKRLKKALRELKRDRDAAIREIGPAHKRIVELERQRARLPDSLILRAKNTIEVCSFEDINFAGQLADEDMPLELLREFVAAVEGDK